MVCIRNAAGEFRANNVQKMKIIVTMVCFLVAPAKFCPESERIMPSKKSDWTSSAEILNYIGAV